jgi:hypothetical protein
MGHFSAKDQILDTRRPDLMKMKFLGFVLINQVEWPKA